MTERIASARNAGKLSCRFDEALRILAETEAGSIVISLSLFDNK
jgi:hypothetical protein